MNWIEQIAHLPKKGKYSQFNEDLIIQHILENIEVKNRYFVDIGAGQYSGEMSNTKLLYEQGWEGIGFDGESEGGYIEKAVIKPHNIITTIEENGIAEIPIFFGLLNLDIDSCDYWVLQSVLEFYTPDIICCEFNGCLDPSSRLALAYEDGYMWDGTDKYGFSFLAGYELLFGYNYTVIYNQHDTNLFAIHNRHQLPPFKAVTAKRNQYHPHNPNAIFIEV